MPVSDNDFSIICLQMCEVSYLPLTQIPQYVAQVNLLVTPGEPWECSWAWQDEDNSNLAFVALHYPSVGAPPDQAILTIRGTDIGVPDLWGVLWQAWEDLDFLIQVPVTWAPEKFKGARIAQGTMKGANEILDLMSPGLSLRTYLKHLFKEYPDLPLTVTGHSLGGCLTTVVASKLKGDHDLLPDAQIQVVTFAGPSAGNQDFADYFQCQFRDTRYWCYASGLDVAPFSWGNLIELDMIYFQLLPPSFPTPDTVTGGILGLMVAMALFQIGYSQPNLTKPPKPARLCGAAPDWYAEAFYQHHPTTYMKWFSGGSDVGIAAPVLVSSGKPTGSTLSTKLEALWEELENFLSGIGSKATT